MNGIITRIISNLCTVTINGKNYDCHPRGKFYFDKITPLVGDKVKIDPKENYILEILPRTNFLTRPMIANVDYAIIMTSVKQPELDLILLDKMLTAIIYNKIKPIICFTKIDLLKRKERKQIKILIRYYNSIGIPTFTNKDLKKIIKLIAHKTVVLCGQTGAGKSSFLNKLDSNLNLQTNEISSALGRGIHTTRHVELFKYKSSLIADTPGFSSLDLDFLSESDIRNTFPEFSVKCPFNDCRHLNEKECEVKKLVKKGKILQSRYDNYVKFVRLK